MELIQVTARRNMTQITFSSEKYRELHDHLRENYHVVQLAVI